MRLRLEPRTMRLLRGLPRVSPYGAVELVLLLLLAWQIARLVWTVLTPVAPLGDWRAPPLAPTASYADIAGSFDPFFRLSGTTGPAMVTDLNIKLFGIRADQASGRGSAIVGLPDGNQISVAVGDEILPGVTLAAVSFDAITIARGGNREQLFLDQSTPAAAVGVQPAPIPAAAASPLAAETALTPRVIDGRVSGFTLQPQGTGAAFRAAGLQPGDVLVGVNGQPVRNAGDAGSLTGAISSGQSAMLEVERGGRVIQVQVQTR